MPSPWRRIAILFLSIFFPSYCVDCVVGLRISATITGWISGSRSCYPPGQQAVGGPVMACPDFLWCVGVGCVGVCSFKQLHWYSHVEPRLSMEAVISKVLAGDCHGQL